MNLSRKRKKELRRLQEDAASLWEQQQHLVDGAAGIAREAGRQLGNYGREQVIPTVQHTYESKVVPAVDRSVKASKHFVDGRVVPAVGGVVGTALTAWDIANQKRADFDGRNREATRAARKTADRFMGNVQSALPQKKGIGAGGVIAIVLGAAAAIGVLYAAWQTLRADDELWVADDPLSAPEA